MTDACRIEDALDAELASTMQVVDCGDLPIVAGIERWQTGQDCMMRALREGRAFRLTHAGVGYDSIESSGIAWRGPPYSAVLFNRSSVPVAASQMKTTRNAQRCVELGVMVGCKAAPGALCLKCTILEVPAEPCLALETP